MKINTKDFGEVEIEKDEILYFPQGLFAFEDVTQFVFMEKDGCKQKWLQSVQGEDPRFIIFDPADIVEGYQPVLPPTALKELELGPSDPFSVYVIAVIPQNIKAMTVNLKSPVVINPQKCLGAQVILDKGNYPIRYHVFRQDGGER